MVSKVASLHAELGFKIDRTKLNEFRRTLERLEQKVNKFGKEFRTEIDRNTATQVDGIKRVGQRVDILNEKYEKQLRTLRQIGNTDITPRNRGTGTAAAAGGAAGAARGAGAGAAVGAAGGVGIVLTIASMLTGASNRLYREFESLQNGLIVTEGSLDNANTTIEELRKVSDKLGQNFMDVAGNYRQWAAALDATPIENMAMRASVATSQFATAMGMTGHELRGLERSLTDMAATGTVKGQDVRQLSNWDVSRTQMALAMGMTMDEFNKGVTAGSIDAFEFLPKLFALMERKAQEGGALQRQQQSTTAERNRAANELLFQNIEANNNGINEFFNEFYQSVKKFSKQVTPLVDEIAEAFEASIPGMKANLSAFGDLLGSLGNLSNSFDGADIEFPLPKFSEVMRGLGNALDDAAGMVSTFRDETSKVNDYINGFGDVVWEQFKRITEGLLNIFVDIGNNLLPGSPISRVNFNKLDETMQTTLDGKSRADRLLRDGLKVDLSGVEALMGRLNSGPGLNPYGGVSPDQLPFGPVRDRQGNTINQTNNMTVNIDGSQQPDEILGTIEDHINGIFRNAAMSDSVTEK